MKKHIKPHYLIIGGTKGLGIEVINQLLALNCKVSVVGRSKLPQAYSKNHDVMLYNFDLLNLKQLNTFLSKFKSQNDFLSGIIFAQRYRGSEKEELDCELEMAVNIPNAIILSLSGHLKKAKSSSIVVVNSNASKYVAPEQSVGYHIAKSAQLGLVRFYAQKLGKQNTRVNSVITNAFIKPETADYYKKQKKRANALKYVSALGSIVTASDIANVILFLLSKNSKMITGQEVTIDSGSSLLVHDACLQK
jgi:NAD(P)-dependent dehydrogenase (short-subunit alcohol dehydrogenase family)